MIENRHSSNRNIIRRIIVRGNLFLDTPTSLGSGDAESLVDVPLLRDTISNHALLTGSSVGGALRNYLREHDQGYYLKENRHDLVSKLFGDLFVYPNEVNILNEQEKIKIKSQDNQSLLIIDDAVSNSRIQSELRDGVKINSITCTAIDKAKYDFEILQAGTEFPLSFELLIEKESDEPSLLKGLAIALQGLKQGEISLGIKKHRGFGRCHVKEWQVWQFDLRDASDRIAWLTLDYSWSTDTPCTKLPAVNASIVEAMKEAELEFPEEWEDQREFCKIDATFTLASPLLIRSGQASSDKAPDVVHLKSRRNGELKPVLSGTSLAGVLRHRAERIINTIGKNTSIIEDIFGSDLSKNKTSEAKASRLIVHESVIENTTDLVQNRIAIDRFTGGTLHGALFNEQPIFPNSETHLKLNLELRNPEDNEIGLLLLLLKDLWTGDLPVGGTSSIGRGRLQGKYLTITLQREQQNTTFTIVQSSENLVVSDAESLEKFVSALNEEVNK
ncbi:RAMP superfamily CRISPR-associated protein [Dolichospermum heterosporum]|uniref:RAMP superfamily CRISPR-associated protein n=1 Tax=Dolichospermum heterosporum TAC447 TaxID=747523 RepID=A0ABY5LYA5_9CYAN|nr:RAMP superfamily CRISPR-associated protein [Dolichospermum heterosporum]UUO15804.1 RAMP superfamily CRISPR-associated protein [Dolichospermum heterosporum TAC447]